MDHFGMGAGVDGAMEVYFRSARRTGRTTSLVESLKTGDRVVFADAREANRVQALCHERGVEIETQVVPPRRPEKLMDRGSVPGVGRLVFDHSWVEQWFQDAVRRAAEDLDRFQIEIGGYGPEHHATKRAAEEIAKWRT